MKKKSWWKISFIELTYVVGEHWNCLDETIPNECVPTTYVTEIKETYFEIYTKQESCPLALHSLKISNSQSVKCLSLYRKLFIPPVRSI